MNASNARLILSAFLSWAIGHYHAAQADVGIAIGNVLYELRA